MMFGTNYQSFVLPACLPHRQAKAGIQRKRLDSASSAE